MTSPPALHLGTYYHLFNRGTNRENIFHDRRCYPLFLNLYAYYVAPVVETYAYCLLRNHFHLLIRVCTKSEILHKLGLTHADEKKVRLVPSRRFSNFFNAYAKKINLAFERTGSLFQHPFRRVIIENDRHLRTVITYIHQNPQRHQLVDDFREWPFSSYHALKTATAKPKNHIQITRLSLEKHSDLRKTDNLFSSREIRPLLIDDLQ